MARDVEEQGYDLLPAFDEELGEMLGREVEVEDMSLEEIAVQNGLCIVEHLPGGGEIEHGDGKEEVHVLVDDEERYLMASKEKRYSEQIEKKRKRKKALMLDVDQEFRMVFRLDEKTDLAEDMIAKIDIEIEYDGKTNEERSIERARELVKFVRENKGKTPSSSAKDQVEKTLSYWFSNTKKAKKGMGKGKLYQSVDDFLVKELGKDWWKEKDLEAQSLEKAEELVNFVIENKGKTPSRSAKDQVEKSLGYWFYNTKQAKKGLSRSKLYQSVDDFLVKELGKDWWNGNIKVKSPLSESSSQPEESHSHRCPINPCTCRISQEEVTLIEDEEPFEQKAAKASSTQMTYLPTIPKAASPSTSHSKPLPPLSQLHKEYKTLHSSNLHVRFQSNRPEWREYHSISEKNEESFGEEVPYKRVIQYIDDCYKNKKSRTIADLGCGMARVSKALVHRKELSFINIDHVACDQTVKEGDIAQTGLEEGEVDLAILCLAMWGSNCEEYLTEAYRILDTQGRLLVIEPSKRWEHGARLRELLLKHNFVINKEEAVLPDGSVKKFCFFVASKR
jgi:hypothetical protein